MNRGITTYLVALSFFTCLNHSSIAASKVKSDKSKQVVNLLVDCSHDYSFNLAYVSKTQKEVLPDVNCLSSCKTIYKLNLKPINCLVLLVDGKLPYSHKDAKHLLDYVEMGGGLYISINTKDKGRYADSVKRFLLAFGLQITGSPSPSNKQQKVIPDDKFKPWPEFKIKAKNISELSPIHPQNWSKLYLTENGTSVMLSRKYGKGFIICDATGLYRVAISKKQPESKILKKLVMYISQNKKVASVTGGGGWQFSEGYRWELTTTTPNGLRIYHNEYSKIFVKNDIIAYQKMLQYLTTLTGLDEKNKANQIKDFKEKNAKMRHGVKINLDVSEVDKLTLLTTDGGNGNKSDHAIYADNYLTDKSGHRSKLLLCDAIKVKSGYGKATQDKLRNNEALTIGGKTYSNGIVLHANGTMTFSLNKRYKSFSSLAGCYDKHNGSVGFKILGDGKTLWDDGKIYLGGQTEVKQDDLNYVPDGVLFQIKYLPCYGGGFLLPQGAAVCLPMNLQDDWRVHLGILSHEMGHAWSYPYCEVLGDEGSAFMFNNLVLNLQYNQKQGDSVTRRLTKYLKIKDLSGVDLSVKRNGRKYYIFIDLMIREYGEEVWKNYNLLKYALLNKEGANWDANSTAWLWSIATGRDIFPFLNKVFNTTVSKEKVQLPLQVIQAGFNPETIGKLYNIPLKELPAKRNILNKIKSFNDVKSFYARELALKGHPKVEG